MCKSREREREGPSGQLSLRGGLSVQREREREGEGEREREREREGEGEREGGRIKDPTCFPKSCHCNADPEVVQTILRLAAGFGLCRQNDPECLIPL